MITDDLELPITRTKLTGPAVDALENRKEHGAAQEVTTAELRARYEAVKDHTLAGLKMLLATVGVSDKQ